jgi:methylisocitrate lyase
MTWLEAEGKEQSLPGERLKDLLEHVDVLAVPGAHNALAGLLARAAGFDALYVSGAALTASLGLPDLGVMTLEELCFFTRTIFRATGLPLIVDADTGYGEALNVMRAVRELEAAGAAAVQIEDQILPKKCGHLNDKRLIPAEDMAAKIAAARRARTHALIIARTDAAPDGLDEVITRARLYLKAGADIIFPEALTTQEEFCSVAKSVEAPLLANMTEFGRTPHFTLRQFRNFGFKIVIWPASSLRVSAYAMQELYAHIQHEGGTKGMLDRMQSRTELYETIGYSDYEALDDSIVRSLPPDTPK